MPYSTPPLDKRDDDAAGASHEEDTTGEEEEARTPQTRKHKLLKYVQQPAPATTSKASNSGKSDSGQFSIADHVDKYQSGESSDRRDPPPSSLYGEAINLKVSGKKDTSPAKKESSPSKKETTPDNKKDDARPVRSLRGHSAKAIPSEVAQSEADIFPRLVDVWSEKERENEAKEVEKHPETTVPEPLPEVKMAETDGKPVDPPHTPAEDAPSKSEEEKVVEDVKTTPNESESADTPPKEEEKEEVADPATADPVAENESAAKDAKETEILQTVEEKTVESVAIEQITKPSTPEPVHPEEPEAVDPAPVPAGEDAQEPLPSVDEERTTTPEDLSRSTHSERDEIVAIDKKEDVARQSVLVSPPEVSYHSIFLLF